MKAKQIYFDGVGKARIVEAELPPLRDTQVLVKVDSCGLCTWERYIYEGTESMPFPFVGGHEIAARVVEKGALAGDDIEIGMPCSVAKWKRCNRCEACRRGYDNHCLANDTPSGNAYSGPGGFSDYFICENYEIFPFSKDAPLHLATLGEPVACVTRSVNRLGVVNGDTVAVLGAGMMGLLFVKLLKLRGCKVLVSQRSEARRKLAAEMGADYVTSPENLVSEALRVTNGVGVAASVYTAGGSEAVNDCLEITRLGGCVMLYAPTHEEQNQISMDLVHFKELDLTGAIRHDKESFRQAVRLLGSGQVDFSDLKLVFGDMANIEAEMKRANEDRDIHRILLRWE